MEKDESRELLNILSLSPQGVDQERLDAFLTKYPYAGWARILSAFRQIHSKSIEVEQAKKSLTLFSTLTFNFPFVYDKWKESFQREVELVSNEIAEVEVEDTVFEDADVLSIDSVPDKQDIAATQNDTKPSRYHDDLMPFSFLWWLNKTRIDFSDTYQPYASNEENEATTAKNGQVDWIDQQIKENIFHMQSPEALLSDSVTKNTVSFEVSKKRHSNIEKFIKEEPQIKPPSATKINLENKARQSAEDESGFVSETLAKIYSEQGLYLKGIETYKKLSLKFPEKSPYFAKLIEKLNEKIN